MVFQVISPFHSLTSSTLFSDLLGHLKIHLDPSAVTGGSEWEELPVCSQLLVHLSSRIGRSDSSLRRQSTQPGLWQPPAVSSMW